MFFNWIDLAVFLVVAYYVWEGGEEGVVKLAAELAVFVGSLGLALKFHAQVGEFFVAKFGTARAWSEVVGYAVTAAGGDFILAHLVSFGLKRVPIRWHRSKWNRVLGAGLSIFKALVIAAFGLLLVRALPLKGSVKKDIEASVLGSRLVSIFEKYGGQVGKSIDEVGLQAQKFFTIRPESNEKVTLNLVEEGCTYQADAAAETQMLVLVNRERTAAGVRALFEVPRITAVARSHSRDMFVRDYFAHMNPEGESVAERLAASGVTYQLAGENLAFAPDLATAHRGLMDSPGHRKNILEPEFSRAGIGVVDGGSCGMMFTQDFAD